MSILSSLRPENVVVDPFPHVVVENILSPELCATLIREFPPLSAFTAGRECRSSFKIERAAVETLRDPTLSDTWKSFLREQLTAEFFGDFVRLFEPHILREYPDIERQFGKLSEWSVGVRGNPADAHCEMQLDAQLVVQTPVRDEPSWDRGPHVKLWNKLFAAMLYLRADDDQSQGADWETHAIRPGVEPVFNPLNVTDQKYLKLTTAVPYRRNTLIVYLNTPRSIQGWSVRTRSEIPMMFLNMIGQMPTDIFAVKQQPGSMPARARGGLRAMLHRPFRWMLGS